jgi:ABC-type glycerol-3-phosphate transport system permease component
MTQVTTHQENPNPWKKIASVFEHWRYQTGIAPGTYIIRAIILLLLVLFFGLPIIWLFITPTKAHAELIKLPALQIGNWAHVVESWTRLISYNRSILFTWAQNSVWYVAIGLVLVIGITVPAGYLLANVTSRIPAGECQLYRSQGVALGNPHHHAPAR